MPIERRPAAARYRPSGTGSSRTTGDPPTTSSLYPDRIRRRPKGADSAGLGTHLDPGTLDLSMTQAYQRAFRHLFDGTVEQYDPWDAAHRTAGPQYPGSTMCSAFRTFQGWTALSDMDHDHPPAAPGTRCCSRGSPASRTSRPATRSGGTAT